MAVTDKSVGMPPPINEEEASIRKHIFDIINAYIKLYSSHDRDACKGASLMGTYKHHFSYYRYYLDTNIKYNPPTIQDTIYIELDLFRDPIVTFEIFEDTMPPF